MAALGIPHEDMVRVILNPETKQKISEMTLRKHFREELNTGMVKAKVKAGMNLLKLTETSAAAAIFYNKVRNGMRENAGQEAPKPQDIEVDATVNARRIAFALRVGADAKAAAGAKAKKKEPAAA